MKLPHRRQFLHLAAGAVALPVVPRFAWAQAYPTRPVRLIVGFPAGSGADIAARLAGQWLSERLGQSFVIENRPGAGSSIAAEAVVRAAPDGYTLLMATAANTINTTLYEQLSFNFARDIEPVCAFERGSIVMVANPSVPAKTVPEFLAYAKTQPGKINMASAGNGTLPHVAGELFKMMTGINMLHVPYRGEAPAITDLIGGQVQLYFSTLPGAMEFIRAGKVRALAVAAAKRSEALPNVPAMGEFLPGYEASSWTGIGAPKNTSPRIIEILNKEINAGLANSVMAARIVDLGMTTLPGSSADFGRFLAEETEKWRKVIRFADIKPA
jgi:tripartite-type tricarboxylate transporter receptor subunit TctC